MPNRIKRERDELTIKLVEKQKESGQPDRDFAPRLGLTADSWRVTKSGRSYPIHILGIILREFPDMEQDVLNYVRGQATKKEIDSQQKKEQA